MLLKIKNLRIINKANIKINGITVITGDNCTGKSTICKTLFTIFDTLYDTKKEINNLCYKKILKKNFSDVFNNQINSLSDLNSIANIVLTIKNKKTIIKFSNNKCIKLKILRETFHNAFYINHSSVKDLLLDLLAKDNILTDEKHSSFTQEIYTILDNIINSNTMLQNNKYNNSIYIDNLPISLKMFIILKLLLKQHVLKKKDMLILDKPEAYLNPKWQMQYAQIIILLQKIFDLNIIITTHSADFLTAIEYYAKKYKNINKCKFYLAKNKDNFNTFIDVTKKTEEIYKQLFAPKFYLDKLNYELTRDK